MRTWYRVILDSYYRGESYRVIRAALYERYVLAPAREASESLVYPLPLGRAAATQIVRDRDAK